MTKRNSLLKIKLKELSGKVIVIDTSIYLYRFLGDGLLPRKYVYYDIII